MSEQTREPGTILVATDGSRLAQATANFAIDLAQRENLKIHGLYVVDEVLVLDGYINYQAELGKEIPKKSNIKLVEMFEEQGTAAIQWLEERCLDAGVPVTSEMLFGGVAESIVEGARQVEILTLGRRGHGHSDSPGRLGRMFRTIAHRSAAPYLVGGDVVRPVKRLLLGYDGTEKAKRALSWAARFQQDYNCETLVVSVAQEVQSQRDWLSEMRADVEAGDLVNYRFIIREGEPANEIAAVAEENQVDFVVVGRYQHSALVDWLTGSNLDRILRQSPLPIFAA
jgi:nucleotide-binding universal stress UspA family protein